MKKSIILTLIFVGILILTAWGWNSSKNAKSTSSLSTKAETMAPALELAAGTLRLEGTDEAIDKTMAAQLLPYWQLLDELNASESTASQETTTVLEKIKEIMTTEQVNAIENMALTQNDASTVKQGTGSSESSTSTQSNTSNVAQVSTGGEPHGSPPIEGGLFATGGGGSSSAGSQISSSVETTSLIEEVIKLLESKVK